MTTAGLEHVGKASSIGDLRRGEAISAGLLLGPAMLLLLVLFLLPVAAVIVIALTDWQFGARTLGFVGLDNFRALADDARFGQSLLNTMAFVAVTVPLTVLLALTIALAIESGRSLRAFYRSLHFLPFMATMAAMAIAWEALLHPTIGLVNQFLHMLGLAGANWLRDEATVLPVLGVIFIWKNLGYAMILFLAGLKAIPSELYDAADIDGADETLSRLSTVTLPLLGPVAMFVAIVVALRAFEVFDTIKVLTQGGPARASEMLLHTLYVESFEFLRTGYGAAVAVVFLAIVVGLTLVQARIMDKRVHYQ